MTTASVPSPDAPRELLTNLKDLTRRVRAAQRGAWFPLLLLGVLLLGGILVDRLTFRVRATPCPAGVDPRVGCTVVREGSALYWTFGLALVYLATAFFYIRRSRERGFGSPVRPYVIAGIVVVVLIAPTRFWHVGQAAAPGATVDFWGLHFHATHGVQSLLTRLTGRAMSVGLPLLVLSWVERNRALLLFALAYLVVELVPIVLPDANAASTDPWSTASRLVVPAVLLLAGALGFGLAQRRHGARASSRDGRA